MNENGRAFQMEHLVRTGRITIRQIDILGYLLRLIGDRIIVDFDYICDTLPDWAKRLLTYDGKTTYNALKNILKIANDKGIITHLMGCDDKRRDQQQHLYMLGPGGQYMLKVDQERHHLLPLLANSRCKLRVVNFNIFSVGSPRKLDIAYDVPQDRSYRFFIGSANPDNGRRAVSYYPESVSPVDVESYLRERIIVKLSPSLSDEDRVEAEEAEIKRQLALLDYVPIDKAKYKLLYPKTRNKEDVPDPEDGLEILESWSSAESTKRS